MFYLIVNIFTNKDLYLNKTTFFKNVVEQGRHELVTETSQLSEHTKVNVKVNFLKSTEIL